MTPKDLFFIILKTLGIFLIKTLIDVALELFSNLLIAIKQGFGPDSATTIAFLSLIFLFYFFWVYLLIFKTGKIVEKLKLENGFSKERFELNISTTSVLGITILIIGGVILIDEIPDIIRFFVTYIQGRSLNPGQYNPDISYLIATGSKILIALLLIGERKRIVSFIASKSPTDTSV